MADDLDDWPIVERLQEMLDGPVPMSVSRQDVRDALTEIERLRAQINIAHNIIGSEAMIWLIVGANHPRAHLDAMREAVNTYWKTYGNAFRGPDDEARREQ